MTHKQTNNTFNVSFLCQKIECRFKEDLYSKYSHYFFHFFGNHFKMLSNLDSGDKSIFTMNHPPLEWSLMLEVFFICITEAWTWDDWLLVELMLVFSMEFEKTPQGLAHIIYISSERSRKLLVQSAQLILPPLGHSIRKECETLRKKISTWIIWSNITRNERYIGIVLAVIHSGETMNRLQGR